MHQNRYKAIDGGKKQKARIMIHDILVQAIHLILYLGGLIYDYLFLCVHLLACTDVCVPAYVCVSACLPVDYTLACLFFYTPMC